MATINDHTNYLLIDHTASPGVSPELAWKWTKHGTITAPGNTRLEADVWTCRHCQAQVIKNPDRTRPREVCRRCMRVVCDRCSAFDCLPFEAIAEAVLSGKYVQSPDSGLILAKE
jgi:hypothetical protein